LFTSLLFVLVVAKFFVDRRVKSLEKKFATVARETDGLLKQPMFKEGNSNKVDPYVTAKRQFLLGQAAQKRDRVEAKYVYWQAFSERFGRLVSRVRSWKGKKLPYTFGAVDVACALGVIDCLGFSDYLGPRALVHFVMAWFTR
jgi:hypothetical protein